jgi:hypothetical protein
VGLDSIAATICTRVSQPLDVVDIAALDYMLVVMRVISCAEEEWINRRSRSRSENVPSLWTKLQLLIRETGNKGLRRNSVFHPQKFSSPSADLRADEAGWLRLDPSGPFRYAITFASSARGQCVVTRRLLWQASPADLERPVNMSSGAFKKRCKTAPLSVPAFDLQGTTQHFDHQGSSSPCSSKLLVRNGRIAHIRDLYGKE